VQQKEVYKSVQHGGEVPLHGFRKPLPEKPKGELNLRYKIYQRHPTIIHFASTTVRNLTDKTLHNSLKETFAMKIR
jgi:hypothetical protein